MSLAYLFDSNIQFQDKSGNNNVNGFLRVYIDNTDDRAVTYKDFNGTLNQADIRLDNNGRAVVIVDDSKTYRLEVYGTTGVLLWTLYPISPKATGINETLEALVAAVKSHTIAIEGLALGKKNKQQAKVISGTTTQTVKSLSQNADGEITVEFEDIDFPYNIKINSPDDSIEVGTPVVDPEWKEETIPISVKRPGLVKADSADTEPGTLIDKLEVVDNVRDPEDPQDVPILSLETTVDGQGNHKVGINEDNLQHVLRSLHDGVGNIIDVLNNMDFDEVPHGSFGSSLNQSPGDGTSTSIQVSIFRPIEVTVGDAISWTKTTEIGGEDFGTVTLEPGTYIICSDIMCQWVGVPRGTYLPQVGNVLGEPFDFSQQQEVHRRMTNVVTVSTTTQFKMRINFDAATPVMGFWINSAQIVKIAGGMSQTNVMHDSTLTGKGSVAEPLGVNNQVVAQSTLGSIKSLVTTKYKGFIALDDADGTGKMDVDTIFNNFAGKFVDNVTAAKKGELYIYEGSLYKCEENYTGVWAASKFTKVTIDSIFNRISDFVTGGVSGGAKRADSEQSGYIDRDGSVKATSSWLTLCYVGDFSGVVVKGYSNAASPAIAFYSSEIPSAASLISKVNYKLGTDEPQYFIEKAPEGTKSILVCTRIAIATDHYFGVSEIPVDYIDKILASIDYLKYVKSGDIGDATNIDHYYYNGTSFAQSSNWTRYFFDVKPNDKEVRCTLCSDNSGFGAVIFFNSANSVMSYVPYTVWNINQTFKVAIPSGAMKFAVCNRSTFLASPTIEVYAERMDSMESILREYVDESVKELADAIEYSSDIDSAEGVDNMYGNGSAVYAYSGSWRRFTFKNRDYGSILVTTQITVAGHYLLLAFYDSTGALISNISYPSQDLMQDKFFEIPEGTDKIVFCNRDASYASPKIKFMAKDLSDVYTRLNELQLTSAVSGVLNIIGMNIPSYNVSVGDICSIADHFKLCVVDDGEVQYTLDQTNILRDEKNLFDSKIDGTDGDVLIVNDVPIYMATGAGKDYSFRLFSLAPFEFDGVAAMKIDVRGDAPSLCFVDNINDGNFYEHEASLLNGKSHFVRNKNNVAYYLSQKNLDGKYVPSESGGVISYIYDANKHFIDSGACRPSVYLNQNTAENAATNKNIADIVYTNKDLKSIEVILALVQAELKTNDINSTSIFGMAFSSDESFIPTEALFTDGTLAGNGVRFKDSNDAWVYCRLVDNPFEGTHGNFVVMLTDWMSPWEIMEQHLALSYAKTHSIQPNTWFVYNETEYKYTNVNGLKGLADGVMTANLFKKFRCKIGSGVTYNGNSVAGNVIEYVIVSSVYRGWVLDVSPHIWLTGINCIANDSYEYTFCYEFDYTKYLMNKSYSEIDEDVLYDFEKKYSGRSKKFLIDNNYTFIKVASKNSCYVAGQVGIFDLGGTIHQFECALVEPDKTKAAEGKKNVRGVKLGYGAYSTKLPRNYLYMNHPRTYVVARAGYSSFVCQNVKR